MKTTYSFLQKLFLICLLFLSSCKKESALSLGETPLKWSVSAEKVELLQSDESSNAITISWDNSAIDEADRENLIYYLQWDIAGNTFKGTNQKEIQTNTNSATFSVKELNAMFSPVYGGGTSVDLDLRLYAANPDGSAANSYYSATVPFRVKTYRTNFIVISGFLPNPTGSDSPAVGSTSGGVTHGGGYEYIQLLALEDIDFSKTPYSVVTANNGSVKADGWATGGTQTYKFNLTEGFAAKGTYFYVGGGSKVINGYSSNQFSTDISNANWIRAIDINVDDETVITGDGFGNSNAGILGNDSGTTGNADGIAIFYGTDVTVNSVPVDVVFYGAIPGSTYNATYGYGYRITTNDFYSIFDKTSGASQPFFNTGTNTKMVINVATQGIFLKLAGKIDTNGQWIEERKTENYTTLSRTSKLEVIESNGTILVQ